MHTTTKEITEELESREGIRKVVVQPHEEFRITTDREDITLTGPAVILINQD